MTQENAVVLDDEDQMSQALAEIRSERADEPVATVEVSQPEPVQAEVSVEPAATQEPAAPAEPSVEDKVKAAREELHRLQSDIGRVNALNAKYMQAMQEAAALREQLAQSQQPKAEPASEESTVDRLAAVAEQVKDFPELAGIVAAVSDAIKQADKKTEEVARRVAAQVVEPLEPLRREQTTRIENEQRAAYDAALATFNSVYPTAAQVVQSEDFNKWLSNQPGPVQFAFHKGKTPQEAMTVMDAYDMHLRRSGLPTVAQINQSQPEPANQPARSAQQATNRLQRAVGIQSRSNGSQGGQPPADDFEASLAYYRQKRLAAARAAA